ncbi:MAG: hypothetical protein D6737_19200 [Chloroflexi bacterium]|nr:MAG: hypothetical protein D6737_19200 [Chloroflexota bacterium]
MASSARALTQQAFDSGDGVVRLAPTWVPRSFCVPGRRLRLDTRDLYALGADRGGIDERWFSSTIAADNGPGTPEDEGLSYIYLDDDNKVTLRDALDEMGADILGQDVIDEYGGWVMYSKFFDNMYPLPHHVHPDDDYVAPLGLRGKPEAYFYPPQYNFALNEYPYTFFGLEPGTTKQQVVECLKRWNDGDNGILELSKAYRLVPGTGWYVPPGVLHAPGTLCTYEPQRASDVYSMWQSLVGDYQVVDRSLLVNIVPEGKHDDYDTIMAMLDWEANVDPEFEKHYHLKPRPSRSDAGYDELWITYGNPYFSAKELTVHPGHTVTITEPYAYGLICVQGYGKFGKFQISSPSKIRFGEMTEDEFFVSAEAARSGITISNHSTTEPLVILKHFNPGHPDMPQEI